MRAHNLHFPDHYWPIQYITDFKSIVEEYKELGMTYDEEKLIAIFLPGIDSCYIQGHLYAIYYNTIIYLPQDQRTFEYRYTK